MMMFSTWLVGRLQSPLPGREAHRRFVPAIKDADLRLSVAPAGARPSAVLIPIIEHSDHSVEVLFTVRSQTLRSHRGQISFPGGRLDGGETHVEAALREAHEEIGIERSQPHVIGALSSLYIPPSNSAVTPIIARIDNQEQWNLSKQEVSEVFTRRLTDFLDHSMYEEREGIIPHLPIPVPIWNVHPSIPLWGATAMMLHELVLLYSDYSQEIP
jgi:8-oxo-dGTP pyrophosphatase MutT (NUDIX family)